MSDCFVPFLTDVQRIRMFLRLILIGFFYSQAKQIGFEEVMRNEIWNSISSLHSEFLTWKTDKCKSNNKKEQRKVDSYVS